MQKSKNPRGKRNSITYWDVKWNQCREVLWGEGDLGINALQRVTEGCKPKRQSPVDADYRIRDNTHYSVGKNVLDRAGSSP